MNPILIDFPSEFETERLHIRMPKPGDGPKVYQAVQASRADIKPWLPFAQKDQTEEETEINIREAHIRFLQREDLRMLAFHKETGELICSTGLHRMDWEVPKFEIGYWVDSRFSGKGYTTETVAGLTAFAFRELKAKRVEIRCDAINHRSRAIPEKLDFTLEGVLHNDDVSVDGQQLRDTCVYAKVKR
ncbi:ribosomal-protein-serine acetyltransferase [Halobacillus andaensis]|uniref:Ribosomal-protein-serine acetyltransferase n=1 Tax=Halobacillus andaensis TaxID=1176239 RepID=A0A917B6H3_HALAA|nr:GNAT family N-acetyltransferase [Halobacillus andaensis]MBP2006097.1 RimJ/RimL family protein N-acetyltransferase [Halobacillus andaensis]GGF23671.1 ribosomal-protein-serine acetyltransferase [Halobacillus andaensis]